MIGAILVPIMVIVIAIVGFIFFKIQDKKKADKIK